MKQLKNNTIKYILTESSNGGRYFDMDNQEREVKNRLVGALRNDGAGHRYPKAAERIKNDFQVQVVPAAVVPGLVAAINPNTRIISISDRVTNALFSPDEKVSNYMLGAVCMLLRHEIGHFVLKHMIREFKLLEESLGTDFAEHTGNFASNSISHLMNDLEDFDLDKIYSPLDRTYVRELKLADETLHGLLPELYAKEWKGKTLKEMWESLCNKVDQLEKEINTYGYEQVANRIKEIEQRDHEKAKLYGKLGTTDDNFIRREILNTRQVYSFNDEPSQIPADSVDDFIKNGYKVPMLDENGNVVIETLSKPLRELVDGIADHFHDVNNALFTEDEIIDLRKKLANSSITTKIDLFNDGKVFVYSPEEKAIAQELLKLYKTDYQKWYEKFEQAINAFIELYIKNFTEMNLTSMLTTEQVFEQAIDELTEVFKDASIDAENKTYLAKYLKDTYNYNL